MKKALLFVLFLFAFVSAGSAFADYNNPLDSAYVAPSVAYGDGVTRTGLIVGTSLEGGWLSVTGELIANTDPSANLMGTVNLGPVKAHAGVNYELNTFGVGMVVGADWNFLVARAKIATLTNGEMMFNNSPYVMLGINIPLGSR